MEDPRQQSPCPFSFICSPFHPLHCCQPFPQTNLHDANTFSSKHVGSSYCPWGQVKIPKCGIKSFPRSGPILPVGSLWKHISLLILTAAYYSLNMATFLWQLTLFSLFALPLYQNLIRPLSLYSNVISFIKPTLSTVVRIVSLAIL